MGRIGDEGPAFGKARRLEAFGGKYGLFAAVQRPQDDSSEMTHQEEIQIGCACIVAGQEEAQGLRAPVGQPEPVQFHHQPDLRRPARGLLEDALHDRKGVDLHLAAGPEEAGGPLDGNRRQGCARGNRRGLPERGLRGEGNRRRGRDRSEIVRPDDPDQVLDDLGEVVVELLAQQGGLEGNALQQALHVRVRHGPAQHGGQGRVGLREVRAEFPELIHLLLKITVEHLCDPPSMRQPISPSS